MSLQQWQQPTSVVARPGGVVVGGTAAPHRDAVSGLVLRVVRPTEGGTDGGLLSLFRPLVASGDDGLSQTFWKPDGSRGEMGLLEALHRRTAANASYLLLQSRPMEELSRNFLPGTRGAATDVRVNLAADLFRMGKIARVVTRLDQIIPDQATGKEVKRGVCEQLPAMTSNEYYLVRYRDYSPWALATFPTDARRAGVFSPKFVEKHFGVRVGQGPGVFVPLSEAQFMYGWEKLLEVHACNPFGPLANTATPGAMDAERNYFPSLNEDQFQAVLAVRPPSENHPTGLGTKGETEFTRGYVPPSSWDWTPGAISRRWSHFLDEQYRQLGRFVLKAGIAVGGVLLVLYFVRRGLGVGAERRVAQAPPAVGRGAGRRSVRGGAVDQQYQAGRYVDGDGGGRNGGGIGGLFATSLRDVFDFMLTPKRYTE